MTAADGPDRMPPESEGVPLGADEVATLRAWIDQGAEAPRRADPRGPPRSTGPTSPRRGRRSRAPADPAWARNPIDAFLAAGHERRGPAAQPPGRARTSGSAASTST